MKNRAEIELDSTAEIRRKWLSTVRSPVGRMALGPVFATKRPPPGGSLAEGCRQRAATVGFADLDRSTPGCAARSR
jgi:hypothetical protein